MGFIRTSPQEDVVLIRHAEPTVDPDRPPSEWQLTPNGKELSRVLGVRLRPSGLRRIVTSPEDKAWATATAVAEVLGVDVVVDERLREVQRPWTEDNFDDTVVRYLEGTPIEGWETIDRVASRLMDSLVSHSGVGPIGVVTHGTAMACLVGAIDRVSRAVFWSDLTMPDAWNLADGVTKRLFHLEFEINSNSK
ncbi:MAG: histidine phosphatase family protein [Acidimicrobiales bacterium]